MRSFGKGFSRVGGGFEVEERFEGACCFGGLSC